MGGSESTPEERQFAVVNSSELEKALEKKSAQKSTLQAKNQPGALILFVDAPDEDGEDAFEAFQPAIADLQTGAPASDRAAFLAVKGPEKGFPLVKAMRDSFTCKVDFTSVPFFEKMYDGLLTMIGLTQPQSVDGEKQQLSAKSGILKLAEMARMNGTLKEKTTKELTSYSFDLSVLRTDGNIAYVDVFEMELHGTDKRSEKFYSIIKSGKAEIWVKMGGVCLRLGNYKKALAKAALKDAAAAALKG